MAAQTGPIDSKSLEAEIRARWGDIDPILDEALRLEPGLRPAFVDLKCGDDRILRQCVERLLDADRVVDALSPADIVTPAAELASAVGTRLGPYELTRALARGGSGQVFAGRRVDGEFEQQVAIKFLSQTLDKRACERFQTECQNLARLDHPNIVHLLDAGVASNGANYLVMQYVDGEPLDRHCDAAGADLAARIELFRQLCEAVHYAHQNLIVHRDLKPSNVLVTAAGEIKLLDFGISQAQDAEGDTTRSMMTPRYAAPEQILGQEATTATDIFSLGMVLHQLLTGRPAFADLPATVEGLAARARVDVPPAPSSVGCSAGAAPPVNPQRYRGDLDAIVLRCLRRDPADRYETVSELLEDLDNWTSKRPVRARSPGALRRTGLFLVRHRWASASAMLVLAAAVLGSAFYLKEIKRQRDHADAAAAYLAGLLFDVKANERNEDNALVIPLTELYRVGLERLDNSAMALGQRISLAGRLANGLKAAGDLEGALAASELAVSMAQRERADSFDHLSAIFHRASLLTRLGQFDKAGLDYQRLVAAIGTTLPETSQASALTLNDFAVLERLRGRPDLARGLSDRALGIAAALPDSGGAYNHSTLWLNQARNYLELDQLEAAEEALNAAFTIRQTHYPPDHFHMAGVWAQKAELARRQGRLAQAVRWFEQAISIAIARVGASHATVLELRARAARVTAEQGDAAAAAAELNQIVQALQQAQRPATELLMPMSTLAHLRSELGDPSGAEQIGQQALALYDELFPDGHPRATALRALLNGSSQLEKIANRADG